MSSPSTEDQEILQGKIYALLSYLSVLCVIPLVFKKDNRFALAHGKQGLVIFVAEVAVFILHIAFPGLLQIGLFLLGILSLWGIVAVLKGQYVKLPVVSDIADKISL